MRRVFVLFVLLLVELMALVLRQLFVFIFEFKSLSKNILYILHITPSPHHHLHSTTASPPQSHQMQLRMSNKSTQIK